MILYVVVDYIGETETGFSARYVVGHTTIWYYAMIFKAQNHAYSIDILEGESEDEIRTLSREHYGYDIIGDDGNELRLWSNHNDSMHIISTEELVYTTIADLDVYTHALTDFISSYFVSEVIAPYFKENTFQTLLRHVFTNYIKSACIWLSEGSGELEDSPIDLIQGLVNQGYVTTIDELGDDIVR